MSDITIFHNPQCGTSRSVLALIRASGAEPRIVEYLKTPPSAAELRALAGRYQNRRPLYHPIRGKGNEETVRADEADFARALAESRITP